MVCLGEEGEDVLYSHRCKLYRYTKDQWKERGIGDIKILQQPQTGTSYNKPPVQRSSG